MKKSNETGNGILEVVFILDRSGSMTGLEEDTIGGFNSMLEKQKQEPGKVVWSTVLFDHTQQVIHDRLPIDQVRPLTGQEYFVRGSTALLDAVGGAIHHIAMCHKYARPEDVPQKTLIIITTDGMENSSVAYTFARVKQMIEREKEQYGWEFLFLGANIDAAAVAGEMGIVRERTAAYINDSEGIRKNFGAFGNAVASMSRMEEMDESVLREVRMDYASRRRDSKGRG